MNVNIKNNQKALLGLIKKQLGIVSLLSFMALSLSACFYREREHHYRDHDRHHDEHHHEHNDERHY